MPIAARVCRTCRWFSAGSRCQHIGQHYARARDEFQTCDEWTGGRRDDLPALRMRDRSAADAREEAKATLGPTAQEVLCNGEGGVLPLARKPPIPPDF
jgi:hypothetical protein